MIISVYNFGKWRRETSNYRNISLHFFQVISNWGRRDRFVDEEICSIPV
jgi:hypothetical protein